MRSFEDIAFDLSNLTSADYHWPAEFSEKTKTALTDIDTLLLGHLSDFLISRASKETKNTVVRRTLWFRGKLFLHSTLNYTTNFHSKANRLCVELAHKIALPEEAICQILLPSIETVEGSSMPDVKGATESEENFFAPEKFLIHSNGTALIDAAQIFKSTVTDPDYFFSRESKKLHLAAEDRDRLHHAVSAGGEICFNTLETMHRRKHGKAGYSLGDALQELNAALSEASIKGKGTEFEACLLEYREPILKFYRLYNSLTATGKIPLQICHISVNSRQVSLEKILLTIFVHAASSITQIVLTDAQMSAAMSIGLLYPCPCLNQWSQDINSIVNVNMKYLFESYLPGMEPPLTPEPLPTTEQLDELSRRYKLAFFNRPVIEGINDQIAIASRPFVKIFIRHAFQPSTNQTEMIAMAQTIRNINDLVLALPLVPEERWRSLFYRLSQMPSHLLLDEHNAHIAQVLQSLPVAHWEMLFKAITASGYACACNLTELHTLFDNLPQPLWSAAVKAAEPIFKNIFQSRSNIFYFFQMYANELPKYYPLFQSLIDSHLQDLPTLSMMIDEVHHRQWGNVCNILQPLLLTLSERPDFFSVLARSIRDSRNAAFVGFLISILPEDRLTIPRLVELLTIISPSDYFTLLHQIESTRLASLFNNMDGFISFLNGIPDGFQRGAVIYSLRTSLIQLKILPHEMQLLLKSFPDYNHELLSAFSIHHPRLIYQLYVTIVTMQEFRTLIPSECKKLALCLLREGIPHVTRIDHITRYCPALPLRSDPNFLHFPNAVQTLVNEMEQERSDATLNDFGMSSRILHRIQQIIEFYQHRPSLEPSFELQEQLLFLQLKAVFTHDFYKAMEALTEWYKDDLRNTQDDALSYSTVDDSILTPTSQASGMGLFSHRSNSLASNDSTPPSSREATSNGADKNIDEELESLLNTRHSL